MAEEIERKFLVPDPDAAPAATGSPERIEQGYLAASRDGDQVRIRSGDELTLAVKRGTGERRLEVEVELSRDQFDTLWPQTDGLRVAKERSRIELGDGLTAELDHYRGDLDGLVVVEVEFRSAEASSAFTAPEWFGREVTEDDRYANAVLAMCGAPVEAD